MSLSISKIGEAGSSTLLPKQLDSTHGIRVLGAVPGGVPAERHGIKWNARLVADTVQAALWRNDGKRGEGDRKNRGILRRPLLAA